MGDYKEAFNVALNCEPVRNSHAGHKLQRSSRCVKHRILGLNRIFRIRSCQNVVLFQVWPDDEVPGFSSAMKSLADSCTQLTHMVLKLLAVGLELEVCPVSVISVFTHADLLQRCCLYVCICLANAGYSLLPFGTACVHTERCPCCPIFTVSERLLILTHGLFRSSTILATSSLHGRLKSMLLHLHFRIVNSL